MEKTDRGVIHMYAYCLFCETQRCKTIAEYINKTHEYQCLYPQIIQRKWVKGIPAEENHDWLPGYLFLYSEQKIRPRFDISGIIRCLGNGELTGQDLRFAEMIYRKNGIIGCVSLVQEGDRCRILDPAWQEITGKVIKMDRGRRRCCIEYEFDGTVRTIWAGYDILKQESSVSIQKK